MTAARRAKSLARRLGWARDAFVSGPAPKAAPAKSDANASVAPAQVKPPFPKAPAGSRRSVKFFDDYPRFFETSVTAPYPWRLNLRYDAIFDENREIFQGARVLDISSHDGRWSLAALKTGAASVVGIEARPDLVQNSHDNLAHYGCDESSYRFIAGDVYEVMENEKIEVDIVMCLGFLYHTLRYNELFKRMSDCNPAWMLIDTEVLPMEPDSLVRIRAEGVGRQNNAVADSLSRGHTVLSGRPSQEAIKVMARAYGYDVKGRSDWGSLLRDNPGADGVTDYRERRRITVRAKKRR